MQPSAPTKSSWSATRGGLWYRWRGYTVRWLLFGVIVQLYQPIPGDGNHYWLQKLTQCLLGLLFGSGCAIVFTLAENKLNRLRMTWKSWVLVVATWLLVKVLFVSLLAVTGDPTE